jgi:hypothetical protein
VTGLLHAVTGEQLWVNVRECRVGEITTSAKDECNPCRDNTFTIVNDNMTCDSCPSDSAVCAYEGKTTEAVPLGSIVVPLDGYWHSSPVFPMMHACPNAAACTGGDKRTTALVAYQKAIAVGNTTLNISLYNSMQCSEGYSGNLCGACLEGYGRSTNNECVKCPDRLLNTLYYILSTCITIVMIIITIKGQLTVASDDDKDDGDADVDAGGDGSRHVQEQPAQKHAAMQVAPAVQTNTPGSKTGQDGHNSAAAPAPAKEAAEEAEEHDDTKISSAPHSIAIKVLVNYLQVAAIISKVDMTWPAVVKNFLSASNEVSNGVSTMVSMDCSLDDAKTPKSVQTVCADSERGCWGALAGRGSMAMQSVRPPSVSVCLCGTQL